MFAVEDTGGVYSDVDTGITGGKNIAEKDALRQIQRPRLFFEIVLWGTRRGYDYCATESYSCTEVGLCIEMLGYNFEGSSEEWIS